MSSPDDDWWDLRAGEYVIGTLDASARDLFERTLRGDVALQSSVRAWQAKFAPLDEGVRLRRPSAHVWTTIERRLFGQEPVVDVGPNDPIDAPRIDVAAPESAGRNRRLTTAHGDVVDLGARRQRRRRGVLMPSVTALSTAAALIMGVMLDQQRTVIVDQRARIGEQEAALGVILRTQGVSVIIGTDGAPLWLVQADFSTERVRVTALSPPPIDESEDYQLWQVLPEGSGVHAVLLLPAANGRSFEIDVPGLARRFDAFAVSLEPDGGSPEAEPTGEVLFQGEVVFTDDASVSDATL